MALIRSLALALLLTACMCPPSAQPPAQSDFDGIYVDDFQSDDINSCKPSDVPLGHHEAREFFRMAHPLTKAELHDHYALAPCYVVGPVRYRGRSCTFEIRAGATATITCDNDSFEFACDTCAALFAPKNCVPVPG